MMKKNYILNILNVTKLQNNPDIALTRTKKLLLSVIKQIFRDNVNFGYFNKEKIITSLFISKNRNYLTIFSKIVKGPFSLLNIEKKKRNGSDMYCFISQALLKFIWGSTM